MAPVLTEVRSRFKRRATESDDVITQYESVTSDRSLDDEGSDILGETKIEPNTYFTGEFQTFHPLFKQREGMTDVASLEEEMGEEEADSWLITGLSEEMPEQVAVPSREVEMAWIAFHATELKGFQGQWIVVEGKKLIAHDFEFLKAVEEARSHGVAVPYVTKIEAEEERPFIG